MWLIVFNIPISSYTSGNNHFTVAFAFFPNVLLIYVKWCELLVTWADRNEKQQNRVVVLQCNKKGLKIHNRSKHIWSISGLLLGLFKGTIFPMVMWGFMSQAKGSPPYLPEVCSDIICNLRGRLQALLVVEISSFSTFFGIKLDVWENSQASKVQKSTFAAI